MYGKPLRNGPRQLDGVLLGRYDMLRSALLSDREDPLPVRSPVVVVVSETNGTVRIFENGEIMLRIEPFRRAMKWKDFEYEPPSSSE